MQPILAALLFTAGCYDLDAVERPGGGGDGGPFDGAPYDAEVDAAIDGYSAVVLLDEPVAYWRLDEPSGSTTARDVVGGHDGTYTGVCDKGAEGILGPGTDTAVLFTENGGCNIVVEDAEALAFTERSSFTVECWLYRMVWADPVVDFFRHTTGDSGTLDGYYLDIQHENAHFGRCRDGGCESAGTAAVQRDGWHHIALVFDQELSDIGAMRVYVDGESDLSMEGTGNVAIEPPGGAAFVLGDARGNDTSLFGVLDECAVYDKALSAQRIAEHVGAK